jgi:PEP-CTERM motif
MKKLVLTSAFALALVPTNAKATTVTDNFSPPSALWSNSSGNWTASGGKYFAQAPSNSPDTYTGLPYDFTNSNFSLTVTINSLRDEGIWLDSDGTINNAVLLVLGGNAQQGNWAYWHIDQNGIQSAPLDVNHNAFTPDLTYTATVLINGSTYQAFNDPDGHFDANSVLLTTLVDSTFSHGMVGLYQYSGGATSFSDFSVTGEISAVPEPSTWAMMILGFVGLGWVAYRRKDGTLRFA